MRWFFGLASCIAAMYIFSFGRHGGSIPGMNPLATARTYTHTAGWTLQHTFQILGGFEVRSMVASVARLIG